MAINFPTSPNTNDIHTESDLSWKFNGTSWDALPTPSVSGNVAYTPAGTGAVATDVETKLRETVSVKDFGAVGDGVADDTAKIQAAIDSLEAGQQLYFPDGVYRCTDTILVDKAIKLKMESADVASRLLFDTAITRTVQTAYTHPDDGTDAAINVALKIAATGVELENLCVDLYVDYTDTSATNFGTDIDVGIFISKAKTILNKCRTRGYWRVAGVYGDCTEDNGTLDRTSLYDCRLQGFWSVYIQGAKKKSSESEILIGDVRGGGGVSDLHASRVWLEGWSHHSNVRGSDSDGGCLKVDGKLYAGASSINAIQGRMWLNCRFDGADPYLIKLENCIRDKFLNCFIDRKTGFVKTDQITGVGDSDCLVSLAAGTKRAYFRDTDIYSSTLDVDASATYEVTGAYDEDLSYVGERSFLPALAFGTGITYTSRSGSYTIQDNRMYFRLAIDCSAIGTADASQIQIAGLPATLDDVYVSATVSNQSTALSTPETAVVGMLSGGNLALWEASGGTTKYTDCNASGTIYITGICYT